MKAQVEANMADQTIEQLQERYRELHTKKIQADTNLENAKAKLEELKAEALMEFGTSDVQELRDILRTRKTENEKSRKAYQSELDRIEADLANVEKNLGDTGDPDVDSEEKS